jgi:hypothetical protein
LICTTTLFRVRQPATINIIPPPTPRTPQPPHPPRKAQKHQSIRTLLSVQSGQVRTVLRHSLTANTCAQHPVSLPRSIKPNHPSPNLPNLQTHARSTETPKHSNASKRSERPGPCRAPPCAHHKHPRKAPGQPAQPQPKNHARDRSAPTTSYNPAPAGGGRVSRGCGGNGTVRVHR